jgi:MYXO-CTERM domain-containing protein
MTRRVFNLFTTSLAAAALAVSTPALADDHEIDWGDYEGVEDDAGGSDDGSGDSSSSISDAETSFKGAIMLAGGIDVTIGSLTEGLIEDDSSYRYAFFSGNTLYAGVEDREGNTIDMIVEFFWFESSIDRGSDFWVAVIKARTSPKLEEDWLLELSDEPILTVHAETMNEDHDAGFRWDWSLPFESYGWDAYGNITMETAYGIGTSAEGSMMAAYEESEDGIEVEANVQTKGYFNSDYRVQTRYQITLWRWEMMVHGTPNDVSWDLYLDSPDRQSQNAYHEYFLVMQADEAKGFTLDRLELSGTVTNPRWYWWDDHSAMSLAVNDIQLERPDYDVDSWDDGGDHEAPNTEEEEEEPDVEEPEEEVEEDVEDTDDSDDGSDDEDPVQEGSTTNVNVDGAPAAKGCSTTGNHNGPLGLLLALGLPLFARRRD